MKQCTICGSNFTRDNCPKCSPSIHPNSTNVVQLNQHKQEEKYPPVPEGFLAEWEKRVELNKQGHIGDIVSGR